MEKAALDTIIQLASSTYGNRADLNTIALPTGATLIDLEQYWDYPKRRRGHYATTTIDAFLAYCDTHASASSAIYVNPDAMTANAIFDNDVEDEPGVSDWGTHTGTLKLQQTAAYTALLALAAPADLSQRGFINIIEDWAPHFTFHDTDGNEINLGTAIAAIRKLDVKAIHNRTQEQGDFSTEKSVLERLAIEAEAGLPATFTFSVVPHLGFVQRHIHCRVRAKADKENVWLSYRIQGHDALTEDLAREFRELLADNAATGGAQIHLGTYTNKQ